MRAQEIGVSAGGVAAGAGSTLLIRRQFDQPGETTVLRPSVLWGLLTGAASIGASMMMGGNHNRSVMWELAEDYGEAALTAGAFSAFSPKGGGVQVPTV